MYLKYLPYTCIVLNWKSMNTLHLNVNFTCWYLLGVHIFEIANAAMWPTVSVAANVFLENGQVIPQTWEDRVKLLSYQK